MSDFKKTVNSYRVGDNWKENFKHINYTNVSESIKSILTKRELNKQYDRLGNHKGTNGKLEPLTLDEQVFRLCVLMDSQMEEKQQERKYIYESGPLSSTNKRKG